MLGVCQPFMEGPCNMEMGMEMRRHAGIEVEWCSMVFGKESLSVSLGKSLLFSVSTSIQFQQLPSTSPFRGAISHRPRQALRKASARKGSRDGGAWRPRPCWAQESSRSARSGRSELSTAVGAWFEAIAGVYRSYCCTACVSYSMCKYVSRAVKCPCAERFTSCKTRHSCWRKKWADLYHALERTCRASSMDWAWRQTWLKKLKIPSINELCRLDKTFWFNMFPSSVFDHQLWGQFWWVSFIGEVFAWSICAVRLRIARSFQCSSMVWAFHSKLMLENCRLPPIALLSNQPEILLCHDYKNSKELASQFEHLCKRSSCFHRNNS